MRPRRQQSYHGPNSRPVPCASTPSVATKRRRHIDTSAGQRDCFLLLDGIESTYHLSHRVCEATKHPNNPVLPLGDLHEWDATQARPWSSPTVIWDDEDRVFKAWYSGSDAAPEKWTAMGYATSQDGVTWEKPHLHLFAWRGSTANNIVALGYGPVLKDNAEPDPAKRYKMFKRGPRLRTDGAITEPAPDYKGSRANYSPDGIHWTEGPKIDIPEWEGRSPDCGNLIRDDQDPDPSRRFKLIWQARTPLSRPDKPWGRAKLLAYGPDMVNIRNGDENPLLDPDDGYEYENHHVLYAPYGGAWVMAYEYGWYVPNGYGIYGSYCADIRLAVSRDGLNFDRLDVPQPVIPRGRNDEWDGGLLVIADKPAIKDGTVHLFYGGNGEEWTSWPGENTPDAYPFASTGQVRVSRLGLASLREDGFTCLETPDREVPGFAITQTIDRSDPTTQLTVNVSDVRQNRSWVEVEVLDATTEQPFDGFGRGDCRDLCTDGLREPVTWRGCGIGDLPANQFKLRFWLYGAARLYAYGFDPA